MSQRDARNYEHALKHLITQWCARDPQLHAVVAGALSALRSRELTAFVDHVPFNHKYLLKYLVSGVVFVNAYVHARVVCASEHQLHAAVAGALCTLC